ncbi:MAG: hypothetical protein ABWZ52_13770 [Acidimicrobiales bacterium]
MRTVVRDIVVEAGETVADVIDEVNEAIEGFAPSVRLTPIPGFSTGTGHPQVAITGTESDVHALQVWWDQGGER